MEINYTGIDSNITKYAIINVNKEIFAKTKHENYQKLANRLAYQFCKSEFNKNELTYLEASEQFYNVLVRLKSRPEFYKYKKEN